MPEVVVIGSINVDRAVEVPVAPARGATLLGGTVLRGPGGKGANQAVALARLGREVAMVGAVGKDIDGDWMFEVLAREGVDTTRVLALDTVTGQAFVFVEPNGESTIVVAPGANGALTAASLDAAADMISNAAVVLAQQEIPVEVIERVAELATGTFVLNPAPARPVSPELLARVDVLVPNRHELAGLSGSKGVDDIAALADIARTLGVSQAVVVTLGEQGALVVDEGEGVHVASVPVEAVDATAAGDTFCAALVDAILDGHNILEATRWAVRVAALTTERPGAMEAIPSRAEVERRFDAGA